MPTTNPRVNVTLSPSLDALVQRLAGLQRTSKSQVLRELLEAAEPALQRAAALMDAASKATREVHVGIARSLERAQTDAEHALGKALQDADTVTADLVSLAEAVKGRRPSRDGMRSSPPGGGAAPSRGVSVPSNPPASNRGVKSTKAGTGRAMRGARK